MVYYDWSRAYGYDHHVVLTPDIVDIPLFLPSSAVTTEYFFALKIYVCSMYCAIFMQKMEEFSQRFLQRKHLTFLFG
jgi:hypothetical protein